MGGRVKKQFQFQFPMPIADPASRIADFYSATTEVEHGKEIVWERLFTRGGPRKLSVLMCGGNIQYSMIDCSGEVGGGRGALSR